MGCHLTSLLLVSECDYCPPITSDLDHDDYAVTRWVGMTDDRTVCLTSVCVCV